MTRAEVEKLEEEYFPKVEKLINEVIDKGASAYVNISFEEIEDPDTRHAHLIIERLRAKSCPSLIMLIAFQDIVNKHPVVAMKLLATALQAIEDMNIDKLVQSKPN